MTSTSVVDKFQTFVNPNEGLSEFTTKLTSITDEMVKDAPQIEDILPTF